MIKLHNKENVKTKMKPNDMGRFDIFNLEKVDFGLAYHTVVGSKETIQAAPVDRLMIVVNGFANTTDTKKEIRDGAIIEIPANESFEYQGQVKYYLVSK